MTCGKTFAFKNITWGRAILELYMSVRKLLFVGGVVLKTCGGGIMVIASMPKAAYSPGEEFPGIFVQCLPFVLQDNTSY